MNEQNDTIQPSVSSFECNICFEEPTDPRVARCGHLYCLDCISCWLEKGSNDCPVCRSRVDLEKLIPVYGRGDITTDNSKPKTRHRRSQSVDRLSNTYTGSVSVRTGLLSFFSFYTASHTVSRNPRVPLSDNDIRRRTITHFLIFLGIVLIILVISS